jgi:hypothetical protein
VEGYCTCGAKLVDDALFCHKCGRPLRDDLPVVEEPTPETRSDVVVVVEDLGAAQTGFQNGVAVRVGVLSAALCFLVMFPAVMLGGAPLQLVVTFLGGFYAVYLYRRRTGVEINVVSGARVGWITGVFLFTLFTVLTTLGIAVVANNGELLKAYEEQVRTMGTSGEQVRQMMEVMKNPGGFALFLGGTLLYLFMMSTLLCSLGGALSAKLLAPKR